MKAYSKATYLFWAWRYTAFAFVCVDSLFFEHQLQRSPSKHLNFKVVVVDCLCWRMKRCDVREHKQPDAANGHGMHAVKSWWKMGMYRSVDPGSYRLEVLITFWYDP
jgi:hypothetical protein